MVASSVDRSPAVAVDAAELAELLLAARDLVSIQFLAMRSVCRAPWCCRECLFIQIEGVEPVHALECRTGRLVRALARLLTLENQLLLSVVLSQSSIERSHREEPDRSDLEAQAEALLSMPGPGPGLVAKPPRETHLEENHAPSA